MDVKTAFLNEQLEEKIYMEPSEGVEKLVRAWRLRKSLYVLKQSPKMWHECFDAFMRDKLFEKSKYDSYVYFNKLPTGFLILLLYVDDILLMSKTRDNIKEFKARLGGVLW